MASQTSQSVSQRVYTTVGVIGHIDHGKTSLVGKLTGVETDTHPEEKRRGITIDLGFAALVEDEYTLAFIDAPGHQKYIGNLLAGVSAVEVGLLVVACDQGIQEQTLEHVSVLNTLGVPNMVVALSRVDLCDDERRMEIREEIEVFLSDFGFTDFPIIETSTETGEGLEELKKELLRASESYTRSKQAMQQEWLLEGPFRMPIDRVLNVPGRGLVVAGTPWSGRVRIGDRLEVAGQGGEYRVREIEVHGHDVDASQMGMRTAINLAGNDSNKDVSRGEELVSPDAFQLSSRLIVQLSMFDSALELKCPAVVQLHTATTSIEARVVGTKLAKAGEVKAVIVEPENPVLATFGQSCLFRRPYPVGSFAGGRVLGVIAASDAHIASKNLVPLAEQLNRLEGDSSEFEEEATSESNVDLKLASRRLQAWVDCLGELKLSDHWCEVQLGIARQHKGEVVQDLLTRNEVLQVGESLVSTGVLKKVEKYLLKLLTVQAEESDDTWCVQNSVVKKCRHMASPQVVELAIENLVQGDGGKSPVVALNGMLAIASEKTQLSKKQRANMQRMLQLYDGQRSPPSTKDVATQLSITMDAVNSLVRHATQQKLLVEFGQGLYINQKMFSTMLAELNEKFGAEEELAVPAIKDLWQVTRKHAIPLLEYCDKNRLTKRLGDVRVAGASLAEFLSSDGDNQISQV